MASQRRRCRRRANRYRRISSSLVTALDFHFDVELCTGRPSLFQFLPSSGKCFVIRAGLRKFHHPSSARCSSKETVFAIGLHVNRATCVSVLCTSRGIVGVATGKMRGESSSNGLGKCGVTGSLRTNPSLALIKWLPPEAAGCQDGPALPRRAPINLSMERP